MLKAFFILVLIGWLLVGKKCPKEYLLITMITLYLTISLRHMVCFIDTYSYVRDYNEIYSTSFKSIGSFYDKDIIFWYITKIFSFVFSGNYTLWFSTLGLFYVLPLYLLLKDYSANYFISLILFCSLGFALFSMTGLRQTLAMGFTMFALSSLIKSNNKLFFIFVTLGALFHKTALVFLILFPLYKLPLTKKHLIVYTFIAAIVYYLSTKYLPLLLLSEVDSRFEAYLQSDSSINYSGLIQQILLFVVSYVLIDQKHIAVENRIFFIMSFLGIFFQSLTGILPEMFRISMYFSIANIFLLANALSKQTKYPLVNYLIILVLVLYFVTSENTGFLRDYYFFFQEVPGSAYRNLIY